MNPFVRTEMLLGHENIENLSLKHVLVFGVGGVGSYVVEALARTGIGSITIVDNDIVSESNINRQIIALSSTIGLYKVEVLKKRILDINPKCIVTDIKKFVTKDNVSEFSFDVDYIVDAIDNISAKIAIIEKAKEKGVKIISSMGTGNKLDPMRFEITDISKTSVCPLARVMRYELKKRNIKGVPVLYSKEEPIHNYKEDNDRRKAVPGSIAFTPGIAGLYIASYVIKELIK